MHCSEIKQIRKSLELSQKAFGKALGVSLSAVQSWESGSRNMSDTAVKLLNELLLENKNTYNVGESPSLNLISSPFYNKKGEKISDKEICDYVSKEIERLKEHISLKKTIDIEALKILMKARKSDGTIDIDKIGD
ncbi:helix-turn-helix domain-containing protein [Aquimarina aggregata]|uniref:helix-turn-helix domain-containing protein n=1 Tax=Aquimarina aggregata TaxID=1642818 RepID=UPI002491F324|nr:helix-turn-helix domain-containing protein [Aquimarina aggregata]